MSPEHHQRASTKALVYGPTTFLVIWLIAFVSLCFLPTATEAHEIRPAIVDLNFTSNQSDRNQLLIKMLVNLESLIAEIGPEHDDTDTAENADIYKKLRAFDSNSLLAASQGFQQRLISGVQISNADGQAISLSLQSITIPPIGNTGVPRDTIIMLNADVPKDVVALRWQWSKAFGEVILRANSESTFLDYASLLSPGQQSDLIQFTRQTEQSAFRIITNYIVIGFEHILPKGLDHILFVVGLFLLTTQWRALVFQVTAFTLAHSITLALGASGLLRISPTIVEPLIALSIVFVCIENLLASRLSRWRITMVFVFGLLHGLGFASVLDAVGLDSNHFFIALLGFNLGVELGQLVVIAICFITVGLWFGNKPYYRRVITRPASVVVGLIGLYWFVERTLL